MARIALGARLGGGAGATARAGDIVLVRSVRRSGRGGQAELERVIGRPEMARDVIEALMLDRGLARGFDPEVEREARRARERSLDGHPQPGRRDMRGLPTFTVDPVSARDFDDAVSAERIDGGGVRVWVHIADVSAHVPEGSALDREAQKARHERVRAGRGRADAAAGAVQRRLLARGRPRPPRRSRWSSTCTAPRSGASAFYRSLIRSDARLDYERVDRIFAGAGAGE